MVGLIELLLIGALVLLMLPGPLRWRFALAAGVLLLGMVLIVERNSVMESGAASEVEPGTAEVTVVEANVYTMSGADAVQALTRDRVAINVSVTLAYHADPAWADAVNERWGDMYADNLMRPVVRASVREVVSTLDADDLWDSDPGYADLISGIEEKVRAQIEPEGFVVDAIWVPDIAFPAEFVEAQSGE
jgi:regulator of protease activity HflC (stomatin/prohibitin superfamily)